MTGSVNFWTMRIIGCGNLERGDDGVGVVVVQRLRQLGIEARVRTGEALDLMEAWAGADDVIVVDAVVTGAPVGTVHVWDDCLAEMPRSLSASTHGFGVPEAIELARTLGRLPSRLRVYGIEGRQFEVGAGISPEVERAGEQVAQEIVALHKR